MARDLFLRCMFFGRRLKRFSFFVLSWCDLWPPTAAILQDLPRGLPSSGSDVLQRAAEQFSGPSSCS